MGLVIVQDVYLEGLISDLDESVQSTASCSLLRVYNGFWDFERSSLSGGEFAILIKGPRPLDVDSVCVSDIHSDSHARQDGMLQRNVCIVICEIGHSSVNCILVGFRVTEVNTLLIVSVHNLSEAVNQDGRLAINLGNLNGLEIFVVCRLHWVGLEVVINQTCEVGVQVSFGVSHPNSI